MEQEGTDGLGNHQVSRGTGKNMYTSTSVNNTTVTVPTPPPSGSPNHRTVSMTVINEDDYTLDGKTGLVPVLVPGFQGWKCPGTLAQTWH